MHRLLLTIGFFFLVMSLSAQDLKYTKKQVKVLTSRKYHGRGYVKNGDGKAAHYLKGEMKKLGLQPMGKTYEQSYSFEVNTFPGKMELSLNGKVLKPGIDFFINPGSDGVSGSFEVVRFGIKEIAQDTLAIRAFFRANHKEQFILLDTAGWGSNPFRKAVREAIAGNMCKARGILEVADTGTIFSVRTFNNDYAKFTLRRRIIPENVTSIKVSAQQKLIEHKTQNLIGFLPGTTDTFMVFSAHYDHLGMMGREVYFPGANDNASGSAMLLDLARVLSTKEHHRYGYAFMWFSGEEAGLLGSQYYVSNPLFPLTKIKQVLNFDMVGTGADGLDIFNGTVLARDYALLDTINKVNQLGIHLVQKSTSRGSDHYSFHAKGVPAFFILTDEKKAPYHVPQDNYERLSFVAYESMFRLFLQYIEAKENGEIIYHTDSHR